MDTNGNTATSMNDIIDEFIDIHDNALGPVHAQVEPVTFDQYEYADYYHYDVSDHVVEYIPVARDTSTGRFIPINQEPIMSDFNPEDANAVSRFFQGIADKIILASQLAKDVEQLRSEVNALKSEVEIYRTNNARLDEEVNRLRTERMELNNQNVELQRGLDRKTVELSQTTQQLQGMIEEASDWQNRSIQTAERLHATEIERDNASYRAIELDDRIKLLETERDLFRVSADRANETLREIKHRLDQASIVIAA